MYASNPRCASWGRSNHVWAGAPHAGSMPIPQRHGASSLHQRRRLMHHAAAISKDLWDYQGTQVQELNLDMMKFMHRLSYGHRNRRSVVVVAYDPLDPACRQIEFEVERLAAGLQNYPEFLVSKLNVRGPGNTSSLRTDAHEATAQFLEAVLDVKQLPTILLYPEGAPGFMRYQDLHGLTAEALLESLNRCQKTILPDRPRVQLQGPLQGGPAAASVASTQPPKMRRSWGWPWRRRKAAAAEPAETGATTTSTTAAPAGAEAGLGSVAAVMTGDGNGRAAKREATVHSTHTTSVQQQPSPTWSVNQSGYWTHSKVWYWGLLGTASLALLVWEKWLGPYLEMRALAARQAARASGGAEDLDPESHLDDLFRLYTLKQQTQQQQQEQDIQAPQITRRPGS